MLRNVWNYIATKSLHTQFVLFLSMLVPLLLGVGVTWLFVEITFFGGKRESLAARAEAALATFALNKSQPIQLKNRQTVVVSATDQDFQSYAHIERDGLKDLSLETYGNLLRKVLADQPRLVVITWIGGLHPVQTSAYQAVFSSIEQAGRTQDVVVALDIEQIQNAPEELKNTFVIKQADDCAYDVTAFCTYKKDFEWMPQYLADRFWNPVPEGHVSLNLPHALPSFLTRLPDRNELEEVSFGQVLGGEQIRFRDKVVFIGNDMLQAERYRKNRGFVRRTFTAQQDRREDILRDGIPFHVFWAQLSEMFMGHWTVAVASKNGCAVIAVLVGALIVLAMTIGGTATALSVFLFIALVYPYVNALNISYLNFYLPVFQIVFAGMLTFAGVTFVALGSNAFRVNYFEQQAKRLEHIADLKANIISLLSHNLNTPIAKLRGLLDVLMTQDLLKEWRRDLNVARKDTGLVQMAVRSVLLQVPLDEGDILMRSQPLGRVLDEFLLNSGSLFKALGLELSVHLDVSTMDSKQWDMPVDVRFVQHALLAICFLRVGSLQHLEFAIQVHLHLKDTEEGPLFTLKAERYREESSYFHDLLRGFLAAGEGAGLWKFSTEMLLLQSPKSKLST